MSTRSSVKRTWTGTLRQESSRISTRARSCENLPSKCRTPRAENPAAHTLGEPALSKCIWTCQKSSVLREFTRKMPHPKNGAPVLLRRSYAHGHLTRAIACENLQEKKTGPKIGKTPVPRLCASLEQFYARIYRKNASEQRAYPDLTPALTLTVRTPQCGHTV